MKSECTVKPAQNVKGVLIRNSDNIYMFRVYGDSHEFIDYQISHDELEVTISPDELASFYVCGEEKYLDHSPEVLGIESKFE